jgi:hypothetical protein
MHVRVMEPHLQLSMHVRMRGHTHPAGDEEERHRAEHDAKCHPKVEYWGRNLRRPHLTFAVCRSMCVRWV